MLVISVKEDKKIVIEVPPSATTRRITLSAYSLKRGVIRFGFEAERDIRIVREKLLKESTTQRDE